MIKNYYWHYIAYEDLKDALKTQHVTEPTPANPKPDRRPWTEEDETRFVSLLEGELDKVFTFQRLKSEEIIRRIATSEQEVNEVVGRLDASARDSRRASERPTDEDFLLLEADLSDIIADVHDLAKFTQLNYTGFQKIIKKHDVGFCSSILLLGSVRLTHGRNKQSGISSPSLPPVSTPSRFSKTTMMLLLSPYLDSMT
jgi:DNA replication licensing factor MCM4